MFSSSKKKGIRGTVFDNNKNPLKGTRVVIEGADLSLPKNNLGEYVVEGTFTDRKGRFWLKKARGDCSILADLKGYLPKRMSGTVPEEGGNQIEFTLKHSPLEIVAHRGGSPYAPENTLASFKKSLQMGFKTFELDVQLTKDGEVVVIHDELVDRVSNSSGLVRSYELEELKQLDVGFWFDDSFKGEQIPTLQEIIDLVKGKAGLQIELKNEFFSYRGMEEKVVNLLKQNNFVDHAMVTSFNEDSIFDMGMRYPGIRLGLLIRKLPEDLSVMRYWTYLHAVLPYVRRVNKKVVDQAQLQGLKVYGWTANTHEEIRRLIRLGVEGIITDQPLRVAEALEQG